MVRECHTACDHCNTWIEIKLKKEKMMELTLDDYDITSMSLGEFKEVKFNERPKENINYSVPNRDNLERES
jgi:hypothetical protein